jgi:hypothetical protein
VGLLSERPLCLRRITASLALGIHDIRYATRLLVKDPFTSGIAVLTFGLDIALFATTFSVVHGSTWRGLPFEDPDELVHFERVNPSQGPGRLAVFGRLNSGVTLEQMRAEFAAISLRLEREFPQTNTGIVAGPSTFHDEYVGADLTNRVHAMLAGMPRP